ncbi:hypothetical protein KSF_104170 [Reticulibacter mediterranei]|uniref:HTH luxR-type domain-containing protein n=1 Tax=Reticulibacter mediterranei TaxID=2778369 RepID=A0A8J3IYP6_9CHLR|nr:tetratricopeptide repeat protein [Reticulibacter mediterranei]GHP00370.1 hypothetical protein KSF_104170 [Reticulibacter mediterranei]
MTLEHSSYKLAFPAPVSRFIGREREVETVKCLLTMQEVRLLTLTGPGGIGKTRLGLHVATALRDHFTNGVFFVNLAHLRDIAFVVPTIAQTLDLKETGDQPLLDQLIASLREKRLLLLLDNFEPVLPAASLVADLLVACPNLKVMVTSRFVLHLQGEQEFAVPPLSVPDSTHLPDLVTLSQYEAVALFLSRVQAVRPAFQLTQANARAIADICVCLDGFPLALELAAAHLKLLSPRALLARLEQRVPLLTNEGRDTPMRQRTLQDTVAWSYQFLAPQEQRLFQWLAIFVNGCTLEAVEALCVALRPDTDAGTVLEGVASLVDKSLLHQTELADGELRFSMFGMIREYGLEALKASGDMEATRCAHASYYLRFAEEIDPELAGPQQAICLERLEQEHDNLRAALSWSLERGECRQEMGDEKEMALRFGVALSRFWNIRGYWNEGQIFLGRALAISSEAQTEVRMKALAEAASFAVYQDESVRGEALCQQSLAQSRAQGDTAGIGWALYLLSELSWQRGELSVVQRLLPEALACFKEVGDQENMAWSLSFLADLASIQGEYVRAQALFEESLTIERQRGNTRGIAGSLLGMARTLFLSVGEAPTLCSCLEQSLALSRELGDKVGITLCLSLSAIVALHQGDAVKARSLVEQSLALSREIGKKPITAWSYFVLGQVAQRLGEYQGARTCYEESLASGNGVAYNLELPFFLEGLASIALLQGEPAKAAQLWGAAEMLREAKRTPLPPVYQTEYQRLVVVARTQLGEQTFTTIWAQGRQSPEQALATQAPLPSPLLKKGNSSEVRPTSSTSPHGLTTREEEVLCLVTQGLTNGQVAQRLCISPRTVDTHLTSIYHKIGVSSRSAATRYVLEHHLF